MKRKIVMSAVLSVVIVASMSIGAFAATGLEEISAYLNKGLGIKLNGQAWQPKDEDGNELYPITYNGSTYLPVRAVGEALGIPIGYDGNTNTVLIGEGVGESAKSADSGTVGKSRSNPAPIGTKVNFSLDGALESYSGTLSVDQVIRGEEAWKMISAANMINGAPKEGYEYILAKISIGIESNKKEGAKVDVSPMNFTLVSTEGKDYDPVLIVPPDPSLRTSLYAGASHSGWAVFQVKKDDANPVIAFGREYDGTGGYWFATK